MGLDIRCDLASHVLDGHGVAAIAVAGGGDGVTASSSPGLFQAVIAVDDQFAKVGVAAFHVQPNDKGHVAAFPDLVRRCTLVGLAGSTHHAGNGVAGAVFGNEVAIIHLEENSYS